MGLDFLGTAFSGSQESQDEEVPMEVDGVKAMMASVKSRGVSVIYCVLPHTNVFY